MGKFGKTLDENIVYEWQDNYISYKSIKNTIKSCKNLEDALQNEAFSNMSIQLSCTVDAFNEHSELFREQLKDLANTSNKQKITLLHKAVSEYINLISFSHWNIKIIIQCLNKVESLVPKSKSLFLTHHFSKISLIA